MTDYISLSTNWPDLHFAHNVLTSVKQYRLVSILYLSYYSLFVSRFWNLTKEVRVIEFYIQRTVRRDTFLLQNQRDALISQIYFWNRTLHVSDSFSVHHQVSRIVHSEIGILVYHRGYADCLLAGSGWNFFQFNPVPASKQSA
jgi:hypothetical protein